MENYYKILGVNIGVSQEDLKRAYREAAKKYHPDCTLLDKETSLKMMQEINAAWEVLSSPLKKAAYDIKIKEAFEEGEQPTTLDESWNAEERKAFNNLVKYCDGFGVSDKIARRVWEVYGLASLWQIQNNPFSCVLMVRNYTLKHAEKLGEHIPLNSPIRQVAYLQIALKENLNGDTYVLRETLKKSFNYILSKQITAYLNDKYKSITDEDFRKKKITEELDQRLEGIDFDSCLSLAEDAIIQDGNILQSQMLYDAEMTIVKMIVNNTQFSVNQVIGVANNLNDEQRQAVYNAHHYQYSCLVGGPGTGKTETIKSIIRSFNQRHYYSSTLIITPTGKAAKRASSLTGYQAMTAHRFILSPSVKEKAYRLRCLIIDEASMKDVFITARVIKFMNRVNPTCHIVFVGDENQLKSVGPGAVLRDIQKHLPKTKLIKNYRQGDGSIILANAEKIGMGDTDLIYEDGVFERVNCHDEYDMFDHIATLENVNNWTIITPLNGTLWGVDAINFLSQKWHNQIENDAYNPKSRPSGIFALGKREKAKVVETEYNTYRNSGDLFVMRSDYKPQRGDVIEKDTLGRVTSSRGGKITCTFPALEFGERDRTATMTRADFERYTIYKKVFRVGDKVMYLVNDAVGSRGELPSLVNGDVGTVSQVYSNHILADFNGYTYRIDRDKKTRQIENIALAYAYTCHKMQGDETDKIIIVLPSTQFADRWWLKTAVTRAKKQVVILDKNCLEQTIRREHPPRKTRLDELIKEYKSQRAGLLKGDN